MPQKEEIKMEKLTDKLLHWYAFCFLEGQITALCKRIADHPGVCDADLADRLFELLLQRKDLLDKKKSNA